MAVIIGSARIDENGAAAGGAAGDQNGREVSTQNWYLNSKGWRVFRAKDPAKRGKIAEAMQAACWNPLIGYDQDQRNSLYYDVKERGFDPAKVSWAVETDCSALVRVCCAYAGITLPDFYTGDQARTMLDSGAFVEMSGAQYQESSDYLMAGDVLVTKTKGHTVVVLTDGPKSGSASVEPEQTYKYGNRTLRINLKGEDVRELQNRLISIGYSCGEAGADGDFGPKTEQAVKAFQRAHMLEIDGVVGPQTYAKLNAVYIPTKGYVEITGGSVNIRTLGNTTGQIIGVAHKGDKLDYRGVIDSESGWFGVKFQGKDGWVSGMYAALRT